MLTSNTKSMDINIIDEILVFGEVGFRNLIYECEIKYCNEVCCVP